MSCAPGLIVGGTEGFGSRFQVMSNLTRFRRYRGRRVPFSSFTLLDIFSAVSSASGPVFMFCATGLIFGATEGVQSCLHVVLSRTCFLWCGGRRFPFSCFTLPDTFSALPRAPGPVFMFCTPGLIFGGPEGVGSRFHVFSLPYSFSAVRRASGLDFFFCTLGLVFGDAERVGSRFHVSRAQIRSRWYRGRRVPFSCFACSESFSAVLGAIGSRFHVLCSRTHFWWCQGRRVTF
jgi:hypothetical protein